MASKLDPHRDMIFDLFLSGITYLQLVEALRTHGCVTNISNVREYIVRLIKKRMKRNGFVNQTTSSSNEVIEPLAPKKTEPATYLDLYSL